MNLFWLAIAGFLSGMTASMGLGGGFVLLIYLSFFTAFPQLESQLMNLLFFIPIAVLSVWIHLKNNLVEKRVLIKTISFGILGVGLGAYLSSVMNGIYLSKLFGGLIFMIGIKEVFHKKKKDSSASR